MPITFRFKITKPPGTPLGMVLGTPTGGGPPMVVSLDSSGLADRTGLLSVGDELVRVNSLVVVRETRLRDVIKVISTSDNLTILVRRWPPGEPRPRRAPPRPPVVVPALGHTAYSWFGDKEATTVQIGLGHTGFSWSVPGVSTSSVGASTPRRRQGGTTAAASQSESSVHGGGQPGSGGKSVWSGLWGRAVGSMNSGMNSMNNSVSNGMSNLREGVRVMLEKPVSPPPPPDVSRTKQSEEAATCPTTCSPPPHENENSDLGEMRRRLEEMEAKCKEVEQERSRMERRASTAEAAVAEAAKDATAALVAADAPLQPPPQQPAVAPATAPAPAPAPALAPDTDADVAAARPVASSTNESLQAQVRALQHRLKFLGHDDDVDDDDDAAGGGGQQLASASRSETLRLGRRLVAGAADTPQVAAGGAAGGARVNHLLAALQSVTLTKGEEKRLEQVRNRIAKRASSPATNGREAE